MAMVTAPFVMKLVHRFDIHIPMLVGIVLQTTGLITASFAKRIWQLFLTQGVLVGFGVGCLYIPTMSVLSQWFDKRRSLVYGVSSAGLGIGGLIFSLAARVMISNLSLAWSMRVIGAVSGTINLLATCLIRSRNKHVLPKNRAFDMKLLRRYDVWLLLWWAFISMLGHIVLLFSLSDFAHSIGLSDVQAASVTAFLNLGTAIGRPFVGLISDRLGRIETAGTLTLLCGLSIFAIWVPATSYWTCILFTFVNGPVFGVFWVVSILTVTGK